MFPLPIRPEKTTEELLDFNRKLGQGIGHLSEIDEIETGVTPKTAIHQIDKVTLYRYQPPADVVQSTTPLLIVYALVNRPYMADLQRGRSMVEGLLQTGQDVYLIDWGYPDASDQGVTLDDYINGYLDECVDVIRTRHGLDAVNLLGICQGGTFSLCYTALHGDKVKNLVTMVTPVDFQTKDDLLSAWVRHVDVDLAVDALGNIPGDLLNLTFLGLKPMRLTSQKYLDMVDTFEDPEKLRNFLRMEKWIFDSPDQAGEAFRQFLKDFYQGNKLIGGEVTLGDQVVDLKAIRNPVLNVFAEQDHLVPPAASKALAGKLGTSDYTEVSFPGGHIGIYVSGRAQKTVPPAIGQWLDARR